MNRWRFAFERRWFTYLGMAIVFAIACVLLSRWQIGRNNETIAANALVHRNYSAAAVPLRDLLPSRSAFDSQLEWREVAMDGRYEPEKQLLARDRSRGSNPGFEVLTPFRLTDGSVFVVDRGWLPVGSKHDTPDTVPAPPAGLVHLTARLQAGETILPGRDAPVGQVAEINLPLIGKLTGTTVITGAYGLLASETPAPPSRPLAAVKPSLDPGPFLSYAFQWILFALFGFGGLAWALRQEYRIRNADDPEEQERAADRARKVAKRGPTDAEIEDAFVDAARIPSTRD